MWVNRVYIKNLRYDEGKKKIPYALTAVRSNLKPKKETSNPMLQDKSTVAIYRLSPPQKRDTKIVSTARGQKKKCTYAHKDRGKVNAEKSPYSTADEKSSARLSKLIQYTLSLSKIILRNGQRPHNLIARIPSRH